MQTIPSATSIGAGAAAAHDWLIPDWPAPSNVHAICTTRAGGVSAPPRDGLNLGIRCGDDPAAVAANRSILQSAIRARPVFLSQVHGTDVRSLAADTPDGETADAGTTTEGGVACIVLAADCLPVLLTNATGTRVAAAHAGWRGLAGGVLGPVLECFGPEALVPESFSATNVIAWLGPCIGPREFEVGAEVRQVFESRHGAAANGLFAPKSEGKWLADLAGLARLQLREAGVTQIRGNDGSDGWCTVRNPSRFFSHRRDTVRLGGSGRFGACIWMD